MTHKAFEMLALGVDYVVVKTLGHEKNTFLTKKTKRKSASASSQISVTTSKSQLETDYLLPLGCVLEKQIYRFCLYPAEKVK